MKTRVFFVFIALPTKKGFFRKEEAHFWLIYRNSYILGHFLQKLLPQRIYV